MASIHWNILRNLPKKPIFLSISDLFSLSTHRLLYLSVFLQSPEVHLNEVGTLIDIWNREGPATRIDREIIFITEASEVLVIVWVSCWGDSQQTVPRILSQCKRCMRLSWWWVECRNDPWHVYHASDSEWNGRRWRNDVISSRKSARLWKVAVLDSTNSVASLSRPESFADQIVTIRLICSVDVSDHMKVSPVKGKTRVVKFDDDQISSQLSGTWRANISDSGQPTRALIRPLNKKSILVTWKFRQVSVHIRVVPKSSD
jgi:hypothetical protein